MKITPQFITALEMSSTIGKQAAEHIASLRHHINDINYRAVTAERQVRDLYRTINKLNRIIVELRTRS